MTETTKEFASRCARFSRELRLAECLVWDQLAEKGEEWPQALTSDGRPDHGGTRRMKAHQCFNNSARTVLGLTAMDPEGLRYAEGFAKAWSGLWWHHAWVVRDGLAVDRTWERPGLRYVGVAYTADELLHGSFADGKVPGQCLLSYEPCGTPWGPDLTEQHVKVLRDGFQKISRSEPAGE